MNIATLIFLALGLSMDAFAAALSDGMTYRTIGKRRSLQIAFFFGFFQALMPVIGFFAGKIFSDFLQACDHWIALALLGGIGLNMIFEALNSEENAISEESISLQTLLLQSIATSIDAFAIGIGFAVMQINILNASLLIGIITLICSFIGVRIGKRLGMLLKQKAEICGGSILIIIGLKIFIEHMFL